MILFYFPTNLQLKRSVVFLPVNAFDGRTFHHQQQKSKATVEQPLLRFPFIHLLANPCDFQTDSMVDSEEHFESTSPEWLRDLPTRNEEIPLAQQALYFLTPFRHLIAVHHQFDEQSSSWNRTRIKEQLTQELKLVVAQVLHLIHHFYSPVSVSSSVWNCLVFLFILKQIANN